MFGEFLTTLITGKDCDDPMSSRQARLKHSITQLHKTISTLYQIAKSRRQKDFFIQTL